MRVSSGIRELKWQSFGFQSSSVVECGDDCGPCCPIPNASSEALYIPVCVLGENVAVPTPTPVSAGSCIACASAIGVPFGLWRWRTLTSASACSGLENKLSPPLPSACGGQDGLIFSGGKTVGESPVTLVSFPFPQ